MSVGSFDQDVTVNDETRGQDHITIQALPLSSSSDTEQSRVMDKEQGEAVELEASQSNNDKSNNNQIAFQASEKGSLAGYRQSTQSPSSAKAKLPLKCKCFFVFQMLPYRCENFICLSPYYCIRKLSTFGSFEI